MGILCGDAAKLKHNLHPLRGREPAVLRQRRHLRVPPGAKFGYNMLHRLHSTGYRASRRSASRGHQAKKIARVLWVLIVLIFLNGAAVQLSVVKPAAPSDN